MQKKNILQSILFLIIITIFFGIYFLYKKDQNIVFIKENIIEKNLDNESNLMKDIEYLSKDNNGNQYKIKSNFGQIDNKNPNLILMTDVEAIISMSNKKKILIFSKYASYNSKNYETDFYNDVKLHYESHNIQAQNLNLSFENNLVSMSNNIIYKNLDTNIIADKLEIDFLNKKTKIFMEDSNQKIKILTKK
jgi:hypothetical protein